MARATNSKLRTLSIMQMLQDETDEDHGLSMSAILARLSELDMTADRKTVYADFDVLREFGLAIGTAQRNPVEYYLERRDFSLDELMLMVDAVQSCRFITQTQADRISRNLRRLASDSQREKLERRVHVDARARGRNDAVLANVDAIHAALREKKKIGFTYWKVGLDGKPHAQHEGETYVVTPMRVTFSENRYYLTAFADKHQAVREYRVDRMRDLAVLPEKAHRCKEISAYEYQVRDSQFFGRFDGPVTTVTMRVDESLMPEVLDHFGAEGRVTPGQDGAANVSARVRVSPAFFGWIAGLNGHVSIEAPATLKEEYRSYLRKLIES